MVLVLMLVSGCEVIAGIFKAGFWSAIILIALIIGLAVYGYKKFTRRD